MLLGALTSAVLKKGVHCLEILEPLRAEAVCSAAPTLLPCMSFSDPLSSLSRGVGGGGRIERHSPFPSGSWGRTQRKPNTDLDFGPAAVVGWVPGRRRGPPLPPGVRESFPGGALELWFEGMGAFASFSFLHLLSRSGGTGGLSVCGPHLCKVRRRCSSQSWH